MSAELKWSYWDGKKLLEFKKKKKRSNFLAAFPRHCSSALPDSSERYRGNPLIHMIHREEDTG